MPNIQEHVGQMAYPEPERSLEGHQLHHATGMASTSPGTQLHTQCPCSDTPLQSMPERPNLQAARQDWQCSTKPDGGLVACTIATSLTSTLKIQWCCAWIEDWACADMNRLHTRDLQDLTTLPASVRSWPVLVTTAEVLFCMTHKAEAKN